MEDVMAYVFLLVVLVGAAAFLQNRKKEQRKKIKTSGGWLTSNRCLDCGVTLGFQPYNRPARPEM